MSALGACEPDPAPTRGPAPASPATEIARDAGAGVGASAALTRYYDGYLAETLRGDLAHARVAYSAVMRAAADEESDVAARAALRLAELESLSGRHRKAIELALRATALGHDNAEIIELADRVQTRLTSVNSRATPVRGPPAGTALLEVSAEVAGRFARGEQLLDAFHRVRVRPRLEELRDGVRAKELAAESAVRAYRAVAAEGEPVASAAAEFRTGTVYHDLSMSLIFDLPLELEARARAQMRRTLHSSASAYLRKARLAYGRSLEAAEAPGLAPGLTERWRLAAEQELAAVDDLLRGSE